MNKQFFNSKRGDKIISVYWFAILFIVAGGIFAMVSIFYSHPFDVREVEGTIMLNKISDCISNAGVLNPAIFNEEFRTNFLDNCHITFATEDLWGDVLQYYLEFEIYNLKDKLSPLVTFSEGNSNLVSSCELQNEKEYSKLAKCSSGKFYSVDENNEQYLIKILSIVRKSEKNVK